MTTGLIYFDNNATTRLDQAVLTAMLPYFTELYGNSASQHHFGLELAKIVEQARADIMYYIGGSDGKIIFTSGATESINIALKGVAFEASVGKTKIVTCATEHQAVLDTCAYLEQIGFEIAFLPVDSMGLVSLAHAEQIIDEQTLAVAIMLVNNETGVIQPIHELARLTHRQDALLICDATQAIGKIPVDVDELNVDILIFSGHKFHAPKGIGALYLKRGMKLAAHMHGGGHEYGLRSGTLNVAGIVGLSKALEIAIKNIEQNTMHIKQKRDLLESKLLSIQGTSLNGHPNLRAPNVSNISFPGIDANTFISEMTYLAVANGSACTSAVFEPSHVLRAMGIDNQAAFGAIRFSLSKFNTEAEVEEVVSLIDKYLLRVTPIH
ncbi:cysteine desulfurase family protein [Mucilaginibacter sp. 10B2]|uniref:cysteine desulfurase family protein n=1 Tax=Mucilaginibacter sp. 10B2 TaxID=3048574 RepID=UPI002B22C2F3|nr:cysteine desulfurase family protein [Mucilaginibacter sp. 10B2]MEB0280704.1 cysteine desulfurase family protein [Mucilaginibacter sp. 10B2]